MNTIGFDECGINTTTNTSGNTPKIHQQYHFKVNNLKYASYDSRLKTFKNWPKCYAKYYTENLCDAGFFYTEIADKIECFFCGVRLSNWNDSDNPLEQHMIWSKNCPFLKMTKGTLCIQQTREKFVVKDEYDNCHS